MAEDLNYPLWQVLCCVHTITLLSSNKVKGHVPGESHCLQCPWQEGSQTLGTHATSILSLKAGTVSDLRMASEA